MIDFQIQCLLEERLEPITPSERELAGFLGKAEHPTTTNATVPAAATT